MSLCHATHLTVAAVAIITTTKWLLTQRNRNIHYCFVVIVTVAVIIGMIAVIVAALEHTCN